MAAFQIKFWQLLLATPAMVLSALAAAAEPVEISGTLDFEQQSFGDFAYRVFEVSTDGAAVMAVQSSADGLEFVAYYQAAGSPGTGHDLGWISEDLEDQNFQGGVTPAGLPGTWLFFVQAYRPQDVASFQAHFDNVISVNLIDPSQIDLFDLISAFKQINILDEDASLLASAPLLSNMLASSYFRANMQAELSLILADTERELEYILEDLDAAERRVDAVQQVLDASALIQEDQAVALEIVEQALQIAQSRVDILEIQGTELLAAREGLRSDLVLLSEIDALTDPNGQEAQFLRQSFATGFLENDGEVSAQITGRYDSTSPNLEIVVPTYLPGSGADILEAPVVEEVPTAGIGPQNGAAAWNPDDWNGTAFVKENDIFRATHRVVLDRDLLEQAAREKLGKDSVDTLGEASKMLTNVLRDEGFADLSFQGIENDAAGFILATGLEQTDANGVPLQGELRHSSTVVKIKDHSLAGYLRALFTSEPGYFRAILFLVSAEQYTNDGPSADFKTMQVWSDKSLKGRLPGAVAARRYSDSHDITALIFEFRKVASPEFIAKNRSNIQAIAHFANTQILKNYLVR